MQGRFSERPYVHSPDDMRYLPHTPDNLKRMMETLKISNISELFSTIPDSVKLKNPLSLPPALSEQELDSIMVGLSRRNADPATWISFLGGGMNRHHIPAAVGALASRSEFTTAYTPYQAEASQGTLQAIFEFQSLICQLTGMDVANASMYDGAQAFAESALMLLRMGKKKKRLLVSGAIHPEYRRTLKTYTSRLEAGVEDIPFDSATGRIDYSALEKSLGNDVAGLLVQSPNFFGVVEDLKELKRLCDGAGALLGVAITEPLSLGVLNPPGAYGAALVCGEGQSFGVPMSFGGPGVGFMTTRTGDVRNLPGRLCGQTVDADGNRGFVLTLAAREQHIRREKATSNICSNQALIALCATIYLSLMGKNGLMKLAQLNLSRAEYAKKALGAVSTLRFSGPTFNEFALKTGDVPKKLDMLKEKGVLGGIHLGKWYPELNDCLLVSVTEMNSKEQIDKFAAAMKS
jgi:glycine dehydrogenase subunit 1